MNERQKFKLQRMELREKRMRQERECGLLVAGLRDILDPTVPVTTIDEEKATDRLLIFVQEIKKLRNIDEQLVILNNELEG